VDGKSDWLISIVKDFDWLKVHINNSFKNSSLNCSRRQLIWRSNARNKFHYRFLRISFLLCFIAENKSNKQYFERALLKSLTNFGHTTLKQWKISQTSHVFECLLLTAEMFCQLTGFGKSLIFNIRSYWRCFLSYIAFFVVRLRISLLLLLAR
jgi:hypothetical protein